MDGFGNLISGLRASQVDGQDGIYINSKYLPNADTFGNVSIGEPFWYENANGLVEIAVNQGRADELFSASVGTKIEKKSS